MKHQADQSPGRTDLQLTALLAYGAFATESGSYVRAVRSSRKLMKERPEFGSQFDVKESLRQLIEEMNRYLRARGVSGETGLAQLMSDGLEFGPRITGSSDLTKEQRVAALTALGRICLVAQKPGQCLTMLDEALSLDPGSIPARVAKVDALSDLGRYSDALRRLREVASQIDQWASRPPTLDLKSAVADKELIQLDIKDPRWFEAKRKVSAQFRGMIASQSQVLNGLSRIEPAVDSP